jgi:hypothetical protein
MQFSYNQIKRVPENVNMKGEIALKQMKGLSTDKFPDDLRRTNHIYIP